MSTPSSDAYWPNSFGPVTRMFVLVMRDTSMATLSENVMVNVCVLDPDSVTSVMVRSAVGATVSATSTLKVPSAVAAARLPDVSLTCPLSSETVYVPLSARSHEPPGAVMR